MKEDNFLHQQGGGSPAPSQSDTLYRHCTRAEALDFTAPSTFRPELWAATGKDKEDKISLVSEDEVRSSDIWRELGAEPLLFGRERSRLTDM